MMHRDHEMELYIPAEPLALDAFLAKAGPHKYTSRKKVGEKWVYEYAEDKTTRNVNALMDYLDNPKRTVTLDSVARSFRVSKQQARDMVNKLVDQGKIQANPGAGAVTYSKRVSEKGTGKPETKKPEVEAKPKAGKTSEAKKETVTELPEKQGPMQGRLHDAHIESLKEIVDQGKWVTTGEKDSGTGWRVNPTFAGKYTALYELAQAGYLEFRETTWQHGFRATEKGKNKVKELRAEENKEDTSGDLERYRTKILDTMTKNPEKTFSLKELRPETYISAYNTKDFVDTLVKRGAVEKVGDNQYKLASKGTAKKEEPTKKEEPKKGDSPQLTKVKNYVMRDMLSDRPGGVSQNEIANKLGLPKASVSELMKQLNKKGLVKDVMIASKHGDIQGYELSQAGKDHLRREREKGYAMATAEKTKEEPKKVIPADKKSKGKYRAQKEGQLSLDFGATPKKKEESKKVEEKKPEAKKEPVLEKPQYDVDFSEGFKAGKTAHDKDPYTDATHAKAAYEKVSSKHGSYYEDGFKAAIDHKRGLYGGENLKIARHLGLVPPPSIDWRPEDEPLNIKRSMDGVEELEEFTKGGPYIGPRGGKYADPQHKIPWKEGGQKKQKKDKEKLSLRHWVSVTDVGLPRMTIDKYRDKDGNYTPERQKLHSQIISKFVDHVASVPKDQKPVALVMMGGGGAGKGTVVRHIMGEANDFVNVNSDDCKEALPEYQQALDLGKKGGKTISARDAAYMAHEESSDISDQVLKSAVESRKNLILDGTGKDANKYQAKIDRLKAQGYHVRVVMPHITLEEAKRRADERAERSGRYVPHDILEMAHHLIPGNFESIARTADEFALFDNGGRPPKAVWTFDGQTENVIDKGFVDSFKKLGKERHNIAKQKGWMKALMEMATLQKAGNMKVSVSMDEMLKRMTTKREEVEDTSSMLDDFMPEMEKHLAGQNNMKKSEKEMNGIEELEMFVKGNGAMPSGEPKLGEGEEEGGNLAGVGKPSGSGNSAAGPAINAPGSSKDKLSEDDAEEEKAMKEHKKPIETIKRSFDTSPQGQRDMMAYENAKRAAELQKGEPEVVVGVGGHKSVEKEPVKLEKSEWSHPDSVVGYSKGGIDNLAADMVKSESFYHGESPTIAPRHALSHFVQCKQCGDKMSKALTACPNCGEGSLQPKVSFISEGHYVDEE